MATTIQSMGHFTAIGMRTHVPWPEALVINTCGQNDTAERGTPTIWAWANPTNRAITHRYHDIEAVSVECLWQGTKLTKSHTEPDPRTLAGEWRRGKGKRPTGAYAGPGQPPITNAGTARRAIYVPAFRNLIEHWLQDKEVQEWLQTARRHPGPVFLRDFDTGRGIDRNGPMSHAWLMSEWLNTGQWPG